MVGGEAVGWCVVGLRTLAYRGVEVDRRAARDRAHREVRVFVSMPRSQHTWGGEGAGGVS